MVRSRRWFIVDGVLFSLIAAAIIFQLSFRRRDPEPEPAVPDLTEPIEAVDGGFWFDGGSVTVRLRGSNGVELRLMNTQDYFPNDSYLPNRIYIGSIDEVTSGKGALVPRGGPAAVKLVNYLASAIAEHDPDFVAGKTGYTNLLNETEPDDISAAKGMMQVLKTGIPASLVGKP